MIRSMLRIQDCVNEHCIQGNKHTFSYMVLELGFFRGLKTMVFPLHVSALYVTW